MPTLTLRAFNSSGRLTSVMSSAFVTSPRKKAYTTSLQPNLRSASCHFVATSPCFFSQSSQRIAIDALTPNRSGACRLDDEGQTWTFSGGSLNAIGESEMLDWVPTQHRVMRVLRPKCACCACDKVAQALAPEWTIVGGFVTPGLLAQVLISKYCNRTPLSAV